MLVAGLIEYGVARQQIIDRGLEGYRLIYEAVAAELEESLAADLEPAKREQAVTDEIHHLPRSQGTVYVGLFRLDGTLIARGDGQGS